MKSLRLFTFLLFSGLRIMAQCAPSFTINPAPVDNDLLRYEFVNTSSAGTDGFASTSTLKYTPSSYSYFPFGSTNHHIFSSAGSYNIKYIYQFEDSSTSTVLCMDSLTQPLTVSYPEAGTIITATASTTDYHQYDFTSSVPAGTGSITYLWSFGDGTSASTVNPTHLYASSGTYAVTLTTTSGSGATYVNHLNVTIASACGVVQSLFLYYSYYNDFNFQDSSSGTLPGQTLAYHWDFGDGNSAITEDNYHVYAAAGTYTVWHSTYWVDSASGTVLCSDSSFQTVTVTMPPPPANYIQGSVMIWPFVGTSDTSQLKVWLINYDSVTNSISAVDSVILTDYYYFNYSFSDQPAGTYYIKAHLLNQVPGTPGYLPTYSDSVFYWADATPVYHSGGSTYAGYFGLIPGTAMSGPGFIAGNISLGANKGTGGSAGVPNVLVVLKDMSGAVFSYTFTDMMGNFSYPNVPAGTYSVFPENMGYETTPYNWITISSTVTDASEINFHQDSVLMNIKPITESIADNEEDDQIFTITPNPATTTITINWKGAAASGKVDAMLLNTNGQVVWRKQVNANSINSSYPVDISSFPNGTYFISLTSGNQQMHQKLEILR